MCPDFLLSRTSIYQAQTHLRTPFYRTGPSGCFQMSVSFLEREKPKKISYLQKQSSWGVLEIKVFLKIPQSSQDNTCARVSLLINLQAWSYLKKTSIGCFYSSSVLDALKTLQMHQNWNLFTHNSEKNYSNIFFNFLV